MSLRSMMMVAAVLLMPATCLPCTTFQLTEGDKIVVGKSYDYETGVGQVMFNKRGLAKMAIPMRPGARPHQWVSKYSSLTFNQYGRDFPNGGMNEKGLVLEIMWLAKSKFPAADQRPEINELQWIQYQLDTQASVAGMVENAQAVRVHRVYGKVHYLACDPTGQCAAFELLDGKMQVTPPDKMVVNTLTNNPYPESAAFLKKHRGFGGKQAPPSGTPSLNRFVRASALSAKLSKKAGDRIKEAFSILDDVRMGENTKWQIVYDISTLQVYFRTLGHWDTKSVKLGAFDKTCRTPARVMELNQDKKGDLSGAFKVSTPALNRTLIDKSFIHLRGKIPKESIEGLIRFPWSFACTLPK